MKIKAVRGTKDILPEDAQIWRFIEGQAKALAINYGYKEIRTPLLEEKQLFTRSIGRSSDIVRKEMYAFSDHKKRVLCLRPEATASVVRAYLEHGLDKSLGLAKLYYFGPMFRAERPQAGRLRQFHHFGVEAIGSASPYLDVEVTALAINILQKIGVADFTLRLNSLGCQKDRVKYKVILRKVLGDKLKHLCPDCQTRYKLNLLRIFDCKNEDCKRITQGLPGIDASLCDRCSEHYTQVKQGLKLLKISYLASPHLVRGLDYYTRTCFEFTHPRLGAQNALGAGGRYDNLVNDLGGPQKAAVGFALGVERLITVLKQNQGRARQVAPDSPALYIAVIGKEARQMAFEMLFSLRQQGISCEMDYLEKSLKGQMRQADKLGAKFVVILGEEELKKQTLILRNMQTKQQKEVKIENLFKEIKSYTNKL